MYVLIVFGRPGCKAFIHPAYHVVPVLIYVYMLPFWLKAKLAFSLWALGAKMASVRVETLDADSWSADRVGTSASA